MESAEDEDLLNLAVSLSEKYKITIKYSDNRITSLALINGELISHTSPVGRTKSIGKATYDTITNLIERIKKAETETKENAH